MNAAAGSGAESLKSTVSNRQHNSVVYQLVIKTKVKMV